MGSIWSRAFGRGKQDETRFALNDLPYYMDQNAMGVYRMPYSASSAEEPATDFLSMVNGAYKDNGVAFACSVARMSIFSEAQFIYRRFTEDDHTGELFYDDSLGILRNPWPNGTSGELLARAIQDTDMCGNHYIVREGVGPDSRLRRLRPDWVTIILTAPPDKAVDSDVVGYLYKPGGTGDKTLWKLYHVEGDQGRVAHWAPIPDPEANYRGMSPLTPVLREIMADRSASIHKQKFFDNAATPNLAVSFKETVTAEQFKEFMSQMDESKHGLEHAYETLYLGGGADVTVVGSDMSQLNFKSLQGLSETRIAAAFRIHPTIVGLSEGLQGSSLNAGNFSSAKNLFVTGTLMPMWRSVCAAYAVLVPELDDAELWFDTRDIAFLRQDQKEIAEIMDEHAQIITKLVMQGFTPDSCVEYIRTEDISVLKHTGLYSVQLQPPGTVGKGYVEGEGNPSGDADGDGEVDAETSTGSITGEEAKPKADTKKPAATAPAKKPVGGDTK